MSKHIVILLKTSHGGLWVIPHIDALQRRGFTVTMVIPPDEGRLRDSLLRNQIPVVNSLFDFSFRPSLGLFRGLLALRRQLRELRPDVIMYHLYASALAARISAFGLHVPTIHMVAGPLYLESPLIREFERVLVRRDSVVIAGSDYTAKLYHELGVPNKALHSIPYGVDTQKFFPGTEMERRAGRRILDIPDRHFLAIMVAYVYAPKELVHAGRGIKGHDVLLETWQSFVRRHPDSSLVIVGAGFDEQGESHREKLMSKFDLGEMNVTWLETVTDVRPLYRTADISISPSLSENHGAALEASACGVPSIVSDAGGLPETVTSSSGWVTSRDSQESLLKALTAARAEFDAGDLALRGTEARSFAEERFSAVRLAENIAEIVSSTLYQARRYDRGQA